jgi:hypothetical protein
MLCGEGNAGDGRAVNGEGLEKLRAMADGFGVLNDDAYTARTRAISDLNPIATQVWKKERTFMQTFRVESNFLPFDPLVFGVK